MTPSTDKCYFVSDVHLGTSTDPRGEREKAFVEFLDSIPEDATALYLLGDIFDFWVDYRDVVPRGFVRVLGRLAALSDRGCRIWFFKGNHDYWVTDYFERELGARIVEDPYVVVEIGGKTFCLGHGDGLGPSDWKSRLIFRLFRNRTCIALLKSLHPRLVFGFARGWSSSSRRGNEGQYSFAGEKDPLYIFADALGRSRKIDYYVFGHEHTPASVDVASGGRMFILGDWGDGPSYLNLSGMYISGRGLPNMDT